MMEFLMKVGSGIIAGMTWSVTGYWKNKKYEDFDWYRFSRAAVLGAIVGAAYGAFNVPMDATMTYLTQIGFTGLVENILKGIYRKFSSWF